MTYDPTPQHELVRTIPGMLPGTCAHALNLGEVAALDVCSPRGGASTVMLDNLSRKALIVALGGVPGDAPVIVEPHGLAGTDELVRVLRRAVDILRRNHGDAPGAMAVAEDIDAVANSLVARQARSAPASEFQAIRAQLDEA